MSENPTFDERIARVRAGDGLAATEFFKKNQPEAPRMIRFRRNLSQRRMADSTGIRPSLLGSFFVRTAAGRFDRRSPAQLVASPKRSAKRCKRLSDRRPQGAPWKDLPDELGATAEALRIRLDRAAGRLATETGLDDDLPLPYAVTPAP